LEGVCGALQAKKVTMACRSCGSRNPTGFAAEMSVHVLGLENVDKSTVLVFPRILVCMNCGFTELTMAENELWLLGKDPAGDVKAAG
jgi:ribosomal protein L40E